MLDVLEALYYFNSLFKGGDLAREGEVRTHADGSKWKKVGGEWERFKGDGGGSSEQKPTNTGFSGRLRALAEQRAAQSSAKPAAKPSQEQGESGREERGHTFDTGRELTSSEIQENRKTTVAELVRRGMDPEKAKISLASTATFTTKEFYNIRCAQRSHGPGCEKIANNPEVKAHYEKIGEQVESFIDNMPKWSSDKAVFRGMSLGSQEDLDKLVTDLKSGEFSFDATSSFSSSADIAKRFAGSSRINEKSRPVLFNVKGSMHATSVAGISDHSSEQEVLMSRKQRFKATGMRKIQDPMRGEITMISLEPVSTTSKSYELPDYLAALDAFNVMLCKKKKEGVPYGGGHIKMPIDAYKETRRLAALKAARSRGKNNAVKAKEAFNKQDFDEAAKYVKGIKHLDDASKKKVINYIHAHQNKQGSPKSEGAFNAIIDSFIKGEDKVIADLVAKKKAIEGKYGGGKKVEEKPKDEQQKPQEGLTGIPALRVQISLGMDEVYDLVKDGHVLSGAKEMIRIGIKLHDVAESLPEGFEREAMQALGMEVGQFGSDTAKAEAQGGLSDKSAFMEELTELVSVVKSQLSHKPDGTAVEPPVNSGDSPEQAQPESTDSAYPDARKMTKVGDQRGSQPGGLYESESGELWYIKTPKSADHAKNEVLASKLYELAGVRTPAMSLAYDVDGKPAVASSWAGLLMEIGGGAKPEGLNLNELYDNFVFDAWLANWDVAGLDYDNLLHDDKGNVWRVDPGGALSYRAMGEPKGDAFSSDVTELNSLLNPERNLQTARLFSGITPENKLNGLKRLKKVSSSDIHKLVDKYGPSDSDQKQHLLSRLLQRRHNLVSKIPEYEGRVKEYRAAKEALANEDKILQEHQKKVSAALKAGVPIPPPPVPEKEHETDAKAKDKHIEYLKKLGISNGYAKQALDAINMFTGDQYKYIRTAQREEGTHWDKMSPDARDKFKKLGNLIEDVIRLSPKWKSTTPIYRGMSFDSEDSFNSFVGAVSKGLPFDFGASSSFSSDIKTAVGFARPDSGVTYSLVCECAGSVLGTSVKHLSSHDHENEILMSKDQRFRVLQATKVVGGKSPKSIGAYLHVVLQPITYTEESSTE